MLMPHVLVTVAPAESVTTHLAVPERVSPAGLNPVAENVVAFALGESIVIPVPPDNQVQAYE
jgi:hypothetical protein